MPWVLGAAASSESLKYRSALAFACARVGPEPAGVFTMDKATFHYHLPQRSVCRSLFQRRLSRCSCCALIISRNPEDDGKSCLLLRQAGAQSRAAAVPPLSVWLWFKIHRFASGSSWRCWDEGVSRCPVLLRAADHTKQQVMSRVFLQSS